jgi:nucleotidyltransferase-like protein
MSSETPDDRDDLPALRERAKELRCLYEVGTALARREQPPQEVFRRVVDALPPAWQFPEDATARIEYFGHTHARPDFEETPWRQWSPISIWRTPVGAVEVVYKRERPAAWEGPFLKEEQQLLDDVARRVGEYLEWKQREMGGERLGGAPEHWRWRQRFAERIAAAIDPARFGVRAVYLAGSTETGSAGAGSDIDLMVVFAGDAAQEQALRLWLEGWSLCLAEVGLQLYGFRSRGLLDLRFVDAARARAEVRAALAGGNVLRELPLMGPALP